MAGPLMAAPALRGRRRTGRPLVAEINVTPLVDVMLVLLVIFMVTAPLLTSSVDVDLPRTQASQSRGQDEPLVVTITAANKLYIQDTEVGEEALVARLAAILRNKPDSRVFVRADRSIAYGRVMEVMGVISAGGFNKVALVTEALNPPATRQGGANRAPAAAPAR
ncbi:MAG: protein TolR [Rhodospirillales bacterium]|jgi:biopolymer transport protein TolR